MSSDAANELQRCVVCGLQPGDCFCAPDAGLRPADRDRLVALVELQREQIGARDRKIVSLQREIDRLKTKP